MPRPKRICCRLSILGALSLLGCAGPQPAPLPATAWALTDVHVVDVAAGVLQRDRTVVIDGDRIVSVQAATEPMPRGLRREAGTGGYLIPGLWDMHVHITDESYLRQFLDHGVTGVRDMGGGLSTPGDGCESIQASTLRTWRDEVGAGHRIGPQIVFGGPAVSGSGWPTSLPARTPEEAVASVRSLVAQGVDFVKVYERIPLPAYRALAAEAGRHGLPFAGHVPGDVGPLRALALGQRSIEHLRDALLVCFSEDRARVARFFEDDGWTADDRAWGWAAHADCPAIVTAFRSGNAWLTPTLTVEAAKVNVEDSAFRDDTRRQALPATVQAGFRAYVASKLAQSPRERGSEHLWWTTQQALVARLHDAGVPLLAGTDSACQGGLPGISLHDELAAMVGAGLSPAAALRTATLAPAAYLRRTDQGEVAAGQRADLVLLAQDPLQDITHTRQPLAVIAAGRIVARRASHHWTNQ